MASNMPNEHEGASVGPTSLMSRLREVFVHTWDLGLTSFGGPPVHFQIFHERFVQGDLHWLDEQTYQELFALCQALPGPASTKMLFSIALCAEDSEQRCFLPGAFAMYGLSLGVQRVQEILPSPVYALLTGLNASTVGIIALAAVQLARGAIKDTLTRSLVILGACAGICYNALWYFPLIMVVSGMFAVIWDLWLAQYIRSLRARLRPGQAGGASSDQENDAIEMRAIETSVRDAASLHRRPVTTDSRATPNVDYTPTLEEQEPSPSHIADPAYGISLPLGIFLFVLFVVMLTTLMTLRATLDYLARWFDLFSTVFLAGTVIFGGGPVVIPLLRSYVVDPGWISSRDFLIGLAIIQALPGPNFNFVVYIGALTLRGSQLPTFLGSILGFLGMFAPGLILVLALQSFWGVLRKKRAMISLLRGINAGAVGLVFTAVYRLWEIGYLTPEASRGQSLALEPWWVVVATLAYAESAWFGVPPPVSIVFGAVLGLCWYGAVGRK
ncbi:putative chromate ion transporter [Auriculariales sp. MPI-PUGE-AT-0066]|nr:putative chromate ion transporter [Auriculariales sp. MPI-PUGE-AT-0066]